MKAEIRRHQGSHQEEDEEGVTCGLNVRRPEKDPPDHGDYHAGQYHQGHDVGHKQQQPIGYGAQECEGEPGEDPRDKELGVDQEQDHESPEEEEVIDPELFAHHPQLEEGIDEHAFEARPEAVKAVFPLSEADDGEKPEDIPQEEADAAYQQDGKDEGFWRSQGNSFMRGEPVDDKNWTTKRTKKKRENTKYPARLNCLLLSEQFKRAYDLLKTILTMPLSSAFIFVIFVLIAFFACFVVQRKY